MISKELLSEICQTNLMSLGKLEVVGSDIGLYDCSMQPDIYMCWNIYELAHKCKEWALNLGYILYSTIHGYECYIDGRSFIDNTPIRFLAESEPEAIFKACQWILNKDSK